MRIKSEIEIMNSWKGNSNPLVSIVSITYNHEKYIENAIEGFLIQKTKFPFEIIIHDDASTDSTTSIILKYAKKYPNIIKPIIQKENQYSQDRRCGAIAIGHAIGDYLAMCEGDDYWTDPNKLQLQIDGIIRNPHCDLCFHSAEIISAISNVAELPDLSYGFYGNSNQIFSVTDIMQKKGNFMPMASILIKKKVIDKLRNDNEEFLMNNFTHFYYQYFGSLGGGALYIAKCMSVYRSMHPGSWTEITSNDSNAFVKSVNKSIDSAIKANKITALKHDHMFLNLISSKINGVLRQDWIPLNTRKIFYSANKKHLTFRRKLPWLLIFRWPFIHRIFLSFNFN